MNVCNITIFEVAYLDLSYFGVVFSVLAVASLIVLAVKVLHDNPVIIAVLASLVLALGITSFTYAQTPNVIKYGIGYDCVTDQLMSVTLQDREGGTSVDPIIYVSTMTAVSTYPVALVTLFRRASSTRGNTHGVTIAGLSLIIYVLGVSLTATSKLVDVTPSAILITASIIETLSYTAITLMTSVKKVVKEIAK